MALQIYHSIYPDNQIPIDISVPQFLLRYNPDDVSPEKIILEDLDTQERKLSYGGLRRDAAVAAAGLVSAFNLTIGDSIVAFAPNSVSWALLAHSVIWFGGIIVGVNPLASAHDLKNYLTVANAKIVVCDPSLRSRLEEVLSSTADLNPKPAIIEIGGDSKDSFPSKYMQFGCHGGTPLPPFDLSGKDNRQYSAAIIFSSGTTGRPKAVQLSHHNLIGHMMGPRTANPELYNWATREVFYTPFAHIFGLISGVVLPPFVGSYIAVMRQFTYQEYIQEVARKKATIMRIVPSTAVIIAKDPALDNIDLSSVNTILCSGATLQAQVVQRLQDLLKGVSIVQGYGMSEGSVAGLRGVRSVEKAGSVGRLYPNVSASPYNFSESTTLTTGSSLRIVDDDLKDVEPGTPGEALVKSPTVFMGYKNDQQGTSESFFNGWLRTGDILSMDKDGFLWFHDRKKEMIKVKGNQVSPAELEDLLNSHPDVLEAAVCGFFDPSRQTEFPIGYARLQGSIPKERRQDTLNKVKKWVDGMVAPYKKLRGGLHYLEEIPKNPNGKILRAKLPVRQEAERVEAKDSLLAKL